MAEDKRTPRMTEDVVFMSEGVTEDERMPKTAKDVVFVSKGTGEVGKVRSVLLTCQS